MTANLGVNPSLTITAQAERAMSLWPNKGEADGRPDQGAAYRRIAAVRPVAPVVPQDVWHKRVATCPSAVGGAAASLPGRRCRPAMFAADNGFGETVPTAVHLVDAQHLLEFGVPNPAGLLADALRLADNAITGLGQ